MKKSELRALISDGETLQVEFKKSYDIERIVDAIICLANGEGGRILIGVTDARQVVGIKPRHGAVTDPTRIEAQIISRTEPSVAASAEIVTLDGADVLIINVPRSDLVVSTTTGKYLRRTIGVKGDPQCLPMRPHEIMSRSDRTCLVSRPDHGTLLWPTSSNAPEWWSEPAAASTAPTLRSYRWAAPHRTTAAVRSTR